MNWAEMDNHHIKSGPWTITKGEPVEKLPKPYGLWFQSKLIVHFATSEEAKKEAEYQEATQI